MSIGDAPAPLVVAVDTGGTFTDVVCALGNAVLSLKVPSTPDDPSRAVIKAVRAVVDRVGGEASPPGREDGSDLASEPGPGPRDRAAKPPIGLLIHGSTVATNALLERQGARVALVTNTGFEDVLEIGRQNRPQLYALVGTRPPPLVPARDRHGVAGRLGPRGEEIEPLSAAELAELPARLRGAEAIAVSLLHSYANAAHERCIADALAGLEVPVTLSSELLPEYREYERTATTVVNAYVAPLMGRYLGRLEAESGAHRVRIMGSGGGAIPVGRAAREAVHTVLSGPAGGVAGALAVAKRTGFDHIITFDMGGTSTDVSLCPGRPLHTRAFAIDGVPIAVPVLDIHTVGAGGGSIARIDAGGALRVGPGSAGAVPGPICYGRGGAAVTVTDAHVWLGRLPADRWPHGRLDRDAIRPHLEALASTLGMDANETAAGIIAVANASMEGALRVISVERGHDPADFTLVCFGGAAGLHAAELARRLGVPRVLVPPAPGVLSAYGMLVAPVRKEASRTVLKRGRRIDEVPLEGPFATLEAQARDAMAGEGIDAHAVSVHRRVDARYRGQSYELTVPAEDWIEAFHTSHDRRYGYALRDAEVEAVTLRVEALAAGATVPGTTLPAATDGAAPAAMQRVWTADGAVDAVVHEREQLRAGHRIAGPAIIAEYSGTTWIPAGWVARVHECGSLLLDLPKDP